MIRAVIFDMFETLVTLFDGRAYLRDSMAKDAGIPVKCFTELWERDEEERTLGGITTEENLFRIFQYYGCRDDTVKRIIEKRIRRGEDVFCHPHPEVFPMLRELKKRGLRLALISNAYSDEAQWIRQSAFLEYFDVMCLSCEEGLQKPETAIFRKCLNRLGVEADQCLYVGDGGSGELFAAQQLGMFPVQAVWYLKQGTRQPVGILEQFMQAKIPSQVVAIMDEMNEKEQRRKKMRIRLERPKLEQKEEALLFRKEFLEHGETVINGSEMLDGIESYEEWLMYITMNANPETADPNWVVTDTFFAVDEAGRIVGVIDLRHELKGFLMDFGHCGYSVRPKERKKGYATEMLSQILSVALQAGLSSIQLSVERSNTASVKTILWNGGVYERSFEYEGETADVYRITLQ